MQLPFTLKEQLFKVDVFLMILLQFFLQLLGVGNMVGSQAWKWKDAVFTGLIQNNNVGPGIIRKNTNFNVMGPTPGFSVNQIKNFVVFIIMMYEFHIH